MSAEKPDSHDSGVAELAGLLFPNERAGLAEQRTAMIARAIFEWEAVCFLIAMLVSPIQSH